MKPLLLAVLLCALCAFTTNVGAAPADPILAFPVISDVHVQSWDQTSKKKFKNALEDLHALSPDSDALIINGDITSGQPDDYAAARSVIESVPHPENTFYTIGNHEFYRAWTSNGSMQPDSFPNGETEQASINRFLRFAGQSSVYYDKWIKGYHFLFLGSERYRQSDPDNGEDAYLSEAQLNWLKQKLAENASLNKPIFVFLHQPLPNTVTGSDVERGVVQHKQLKEIQGAYPQVIFFTSHTHYLLGSPNTVVRDRFLMVNTSSAQEPWSFKDRQPLEGNFSEGLLIRVYKDSVLIAGRDFANRQWIQYAQYIIPVPPAGDGRSHL